MLTGPGEKKVIQDISGQEKPVSENVAQKPEGVGVSKLGELPVAKETGEGIAGKLKELMEASGQKQAEIDEIKINELKGLVKINYKLFSDTKLSRFNNDINPFAPDNIKFHDTTGKLMRIEMKDLPNSRHYRKMEIICKRS